jgi:hypothetical protein
METLDFSPFRIFFRVSKISSNANCENGFISSVSFLVKFHYFFDKGIEKILENFLFSSENLINFAKFC